MVILWFRSWHSSRLLKIFSLTYFLDFCLNTMVNKYGNNLVPLYKSKFHGTYFQRKCLPVSNQHIVKVARLLHAKMLFFYFLEKQNNKTPPRKTSLPDKLITIMTKHVLPQQTPCIIFIHSEESFVVVKCLSVIEENQL